MKKLIRIKRVLHKYGMKHEVIIRENEVVVCEIKEIRENIIINEAGGLRLEMQNGVQLYLSEDTLHEYLRESSEERVKEQIKDVIESRHQEQLISDEEIEKAYRDNAFLSKYISESCDSVIFDYQL